MFARDSFENVLFGICRFVEATERIPHSVTVVSWAFKQRRFAMHLDAIRFPANQFAFIGANDPLDLVGAEKGEHAALARFATDPYGHGTVLDGKRVERNPFNRVPPYTESCPMLEALLRHVGPGQFRGNLPW